MAYAANKKPGELTALTTLATDDVFVVGDTSDVSEVAKYITKANLITDLGTSFAAALGADDNYVTDAQKIVIGNTSGTNTGDQTNITGNAATVTTNANLTGHVTSTGNAAILGSFTKAQLTTAVSDGDPLYVGDVTTNATHTGDATGSGALAVVALNGTSLAGLATGVLKNTTATGVPFISKVALTEPATGSTLTIAEGKTLTASNTLTLTATDASTLAIGTGGTLGSAAYTASTAYATSAQGTTADNALPKSGGTMTGNITLGENTSIDLDPAGSADGKYSGICITGTAGATLAFGDLIYLAVADSRWELTDSDATATSGTPLIGMCVLAAAGDASATKILLQGTIRADAKFPALTIGAPAYVGETAGAIQTAIPTGADNVIRVVGRALTADELYFCPSQDHQVTVA